MNAIKLLPFFLLLVTASGSAQLPSILDDNVPTPAPVEVIVSDPVPVTFDTADSVSLISTADGRVRIIAVGKDGKSKTGVILATENQPNSWISVHPAKTFFPVRSLKPMPAVLDQLQTVQRYLIEGEPGTSYWVSVNSLGDNPPTWTQITIPSTVEQPNDPPTNPTDPTDPPQTDYAAVEKEAKSRADAIGDVDTRSQLAKAYQTAAQQTKGAATLPEAIELTQKLVNSVFLARSQENRRKYGSKWFDDWRTPVDAVLVASNPTTPAQYSNAMQAIANGLEAPGPAMVVPITSPATVTLIGSPGCQPCLQWMRDVAPSLQEKGWELAKIEDFAQPMHFVIGVNGRTARHDGFMSIAQFTAIVNSLR